MARHGAGRLTGTETRHPPNLAHLADLKQQSAHLIITSPLNDAKPSAWLREQLGTPVAVLPQTVGAVPDGEDLFSLFDEIVSTVSEAAHQ